MLMHRTRSTPASSAALAASAGAVSGLVAIPHVEVEDADAGLQQLVDLLAEPREIGRVERRLDHRGLGPLAPAHGGASLGDAQTRNEEAARAVHVREREQELGSPWMREL